VTFLALLELVKRREVTVEQDRPWGPILVRPVPRPEAPLPRGRRLRPDAGANDADLEDEA
jgi:hypothetical protein